MVLKDVAHRHELDVVVGETAVLGGTGAAQDCCLTNDNIQLVAMGDVFKDHLDKSRQKLTEALGEKYAVKDDYAFTGFDAYKKVLATDVDLVILATPPGFRP